MADTKLLREIESLPDVYAGEVLNYIKYLKTRNTGIGELLVSEQVLARDWNTPEEDELWAKM